MSAVISITGLRKEYDDLVAVVDSCSSSKVLSLMMPFVLVADLDKPDIPAAFILTGIILQVGIGYLILLAIQKRLSRPMHSPVAGEA